MRIDTIERRVRKENDANKIFLFLFTTTCFRRSSFRYFEDVPAALTDDEDDRSGRSRSEEGTEDNEHSPQYYEDRGSYQSLPITKREASEHSGMSARDRGRGNHRVGTSTPFTHERARVPLYTTRDHRRPPGATFATPYTINSSQYGPSKMFKVDPFPDNTEPTDQFHEWSYWKSNFEMAVEKAGIFDQRMRAIELTLHIGNGIRRIIHERDMMPSERDVEPGHPFYENLIDALDTHFRGLSDETVDIAKFNAMKQEPKETAMMFEIRLRQMARRVGETNQKMIRTRFIEGLKNVQLQNKAFVENIAIKDIVHMASRMETAEKKYLVDLSPLNVDALDTAKFRRRDAQPEGVDAGYAVGPRSSFRGNTSYGGTSSASSGSSGVMRRTYAGTRPSAASYQPRQWNERCERCGVREHRNTECQAVNAECFTCGETGHFRHMCPKRINTAGTSKANVKQVREISHDERNYDKTM